MKIYKFLKILSSFPENVEKNLENFGNMDLYLVSAAEPPEASENIKNRRNSNGNLQNVENFPEFLANFEFTNLF